MGNEEGMSWETTDVLSADTSDVLSADTTDVLSADTTDVLSADTRNLCAPETALPQGLFSPAKSVVRPRQRSRRFFPPPEKKALRLRQRSRKVFLQAQNGSPLKNLQGLGREWEPFYEC